MYGWEERFSSWVWSRYLGTLENTWRTCVRFRSSRGISLRSAFLADVLCASALAAIVGRSCHFSNGSSCQHLPLSQSTAYSGGKSFMIVRSFRACAVRFRSINCCRLPQLTALLWYKFVFVFFLSAPFFSFSFFYF